MITPNDQSESQALLQPFELKDLHLKNRIVMAPMTRGRAGSERLANALMAEHYVQRAGAGLLVTEATTVSAQGNGWVNTPGIYTDEQGAAWKQVTDAVHAQGTPIFLQLWHTGRASHSDFHDGELPVSASAIKNGGEYVTTPQGHQPYETPRALSTEEVPGVVADYVAATRRAKDAGFDGVEFHAANGYLLDQFLQSKTNHRDDAYGGSIENRFRILREAVEGASEVFGPNRVGVRIAPNGIYNDMGSPDFRETFTYVARELDAYGLAYLHVVDGLDSGFHDIGEAMTLEDFRALFSGPIIGNLGYSQETAEAAIARGAADLIAMGRSFITNPDLVERYRNGWPLAEHSDPSTWYGGDSEGYTNFPAYEL